jgi:hypothetical protein
MVSPIKPTDTTTTRNAKAVHQQGEEFTPACDRCLRLKRPCVRLLDSHPFFTRTHPQPLKKCYQCTRAGKGCTYTGPINKNTTPHPLHEPSDQSEEASNQEFESEEEEGPATPTPPPTKRIKLWRAPVVLEEPEEEVVEESEDEVFEANEGSRMSEQTKERIRAALRKMGNGFMELVDALLD